MSGGEPRFERRAHGGVPTRIGDAEHREERYEDSHAEKKPGIPAVPRTKSQPHMQSETSMEPDGKHQKKLARQPGGPFRDPVLIEYPVIAVVEAIKSVTGSHIDGVGNKEQGDCET